MIYVLLMFNTDGTLSPIAYTDGVAEILDVAMEKIAFGYPRSQLLIKRKLY